MTATVHIHSDLVEACKKGNRQAQFELYRLYSKALFNVSLRLLNNREDAEDVLQSAFAHIFNKLDTYRFESSIGTWMKKIVVNHSLNFLRSKRMEWEELKETFHQMPEEVAVDDKQLNINAIRAALSKLPEGYRVVFSLYAMEGYDHEEIAEVLNISVATSKSQYCRARAKLKEMITVEEVLN